MRVSAAALCGLLALALPPHALRAQSAFEDTAAGVREPSLLEQILDGLRQFRLRRRGRPFAPPAPPARMSQTGLYQDIRAKVIAAGNEPFEPQYPLWSDGAEKARWIRLPQGARIDTSDIDRWDFPVGTRFWKEFSFSKDGTGPRHRVETRYMEKTGPSAWLFASYVWNAEESEASLAPDVGIKNVFPIGGGLSHDIPSLSSCNKCHSRGGDSVLGFDALQLSTDRDGPLGVGLDLQRLVERGMISAAPGRQPKIVARTLAARNALGYLHANCGGCHNPGGTSKDSKMFLRYQIAGTRAESDIPAIATAVGKLTTDYQMPGRTETYRIKPGDPAQSAVLYRMHVRGTAEQMPPIGTKRSDSAGMAGLAAWIETLPAR